MIKTSNLLELDSNIPQILKWNFLLHDPPTVWQMHCIRNRTPRR